MRAKRVLIASYVPLEFDRGSGQRRLMHLIEFLVEDGWAVSFLAHQSLRERRYVRTLQQRGVAVYENTNASELIAGGCFDLALFAFWPVAETFLPSIRSLSPTTRVIVDSIDVHFLRNARSVFSRHGDGKYPLLRSGYGSDVIRELNVYAAADAVLTVSQKEADLINDLTADPTLAQVVADCEELEHNPLPMDQRRGIVFVGLFRHAPNVDAVEYLCKQVLPKVDPSLLARHPVRIIGAGLGEDVQAFGQGLVNVRMVGWVPSVWPYLESARISVAPLRFGAGTKRKVLQSLLAGAPIVSTSIGVEGLDLEHEKDVLVADDADAFAGAIERLLSDDLLWQRLAGSGSNRIQETHGPAGVRACFREVLKTVNLREPKPAILGMETVQRVLTVAEYQALIHRVRDAVRQNVPDRATVVVISKGDDRLVQWNGFRAWHFPQNSAGVYSGHYLANSAEVIDSLEGLCSRGAEYLVLPETAFWWLDYYKGFRIHLDSRHRLIWSDDDCIIYRLTAAEVKD